MKRYLLGIVAAILIVAAFVALRDEAPPSAASGTAAPAAPAPAVALAPQAAPALSTFGPNRPERVTALRPSKAPWSTYDDRYRKGDYPWLLANARSAPERGSYMFAIKALVPCETLLRKGTRDQQTLELERTERDPTLLAVRRKALEAMFTRCANLPGLDTLSKDVAALKAEALAAGDALYVVERDAPGIGETRIPREIRQKRLLEILALDDASALTSLHGTFNGPGTTLEGEAIASPTDAVAYQAAWSLALCADYGECGGPDSVQAHERCLYRADCDYLDSWQLVQRDLPNYLEARVRNYYGRIHDNLARGNYAAFGVN